MGSSNKKTTIPYITTGKKIDVKSSITESDASKAFDVENTGRTNLLRNYKTPKKTIGKSNTTVRSSEASYDYTQYTLSKDMTLDTMVKKMNETLHLSNTGDTVRKNFVKNTKYYNIAPD